MKDYSGIIVAENPIPYDDDIICSVISKFNMTYKDARTEIQMNRHTAFTTAYYLTLKLFLRQGGQSPADLTKYNLNKMLVSDY